MIQSVNRTKDVSEYPNRNVSDSISYLVLTDHFI